QILHTAGDVEVAEVKGPAVARVYPRRAVSRARGVRRTGARLEDVLEGRDGLLRLVPVSGAHVLAADPDLADLAVRQLAGRLGVHDDGPLGEAALARRGLRDGLGRVFRHLDEPVVVQLVPVDVDDLRRFAGQRRGYEERRLGQPVGGLDGDGVETVGAEGLVEAAHGGGRNGLAAVEHRLDVGQVQRLLAVLG